MRLSLGRWLGLTLLTLHAAACAPPGQGTAGRGGTLAVGLAGPAAVEWLDQGHGRRVTALARPPVQVAIGPGDRVVALTVGAAGGGPMELEVVRPGGAADAQPGGLRPAGLETSGAAWLAADGERYALVAYQRRTGGRPPAGTASPTDGARCALLVVDLLAGASVSAPGPCRADERVRSLVLQPGGGLNGAGPPPAVHAHVGLEDTRSGSENGAGRLMLVALPSGGVVGSIALPGTPVDLRLASGDRDAPAALYVLEQSGGAGGLAPTPERGRVVVLDPLTLDVLGEHALTSHASRLLPAPDGRSVFLVHQDTVQRLDLATGKLRQVARLPGRVVAAELLADRLYLGSPEARALWVLDTRTGSRLPDLRLPGHPVSLALAVRWAS